MCVNTAKRIPYVKSTYCLFRRRLSSRQNAENRAGEILSCLMVCCAKPLRISGFYGGDRLRQDMLCGGIFGALVLPASERINLPVWRV